MARAGTAAPVCMRSWRWTEATPAPTRRFVGGLAIAALSVTVTCLVNLATKPVVLWLTDREAHPTKSSYEKSSFTKLILAYVLNTVVVPIFVSLVTLYDPIEDRFLLHLAQLDGHTAACSQPMSFHLSQRNITNEIKNEI